jgi:hypothetical protein
MSMSANVPKLDDFLKPGQALPPDDVMIAKALEILEHSPHGQHLADFVRDEKIDIRIIATPQPVTYLPETKHVYVGFNRNNPVSPSAFVLMLAGVLREAVQEAGGVPHPPLSSPREEHIKTGLAKNEDVLWYMCTVAVELDEQEAFSKFRFLDELRKIKDNEIVDLYLKQERPPK